MKKKYNKNEEIYYDLNESLILASQTSNLEIIRLFIESGADVNASSKEGKTALAEASKQGNLEIVKFLSENGADLRIILKFNYNA